MYEITYLDKAGQKRIEEISDRNIIAFYQTRIKDINVIEVKKV